MKPLVCAAGLPSKEYHEFKCHSEAAGVFWEKRYGC